MHGPVNISLAPVSLPSDDPVVETTRELSGEFPYNEDQNGGDPIGIGNNTCSCCSYLLRSLFLIDPMTRMATKHVWKRDAL